MNTTGDLVSKWKSTYEKYLNVSGVPENRCESIWVDISNALMARWNEDEQFRRVYLDCFSNVLIHMIEEYAKLIEYYNRFGHIVPEVKGTGGRWLP